MTEQPDFSNVKHVYTAIVNLASHNSHGDNTDLVRCVMDTALYKCLEQLDPQQRSTVWNDLAGVKTGTDEHTTSWKRGDRVRVIQTGIEGIVDCNLGPKFHPPIVLTSGAMHFETELERL
jgi:hypothetical protein